MDRTFLLYGIRYTLTDGIHSYFVSLEDGTTHWSVNARKAKQFFELQDAEKILDIIKPTVTDGDSMSIVPINLIIPA